MRCLAIAMLSGCSSVLGIHDFGPTDAASTDGHDGSPMFDGLVTDAASCSSPFDEDGDGISDRCDNCPHLAGDQHDSDNDDVGDLCDPSAAEQNRLVAFYGFNTGETSPMLLVDGGSAWSMQNGILVGNGSVYLRTATAGAQNITVETAFTITAIVPNAVSSVGIWANADPVSADPVLPDGILGEIASSPGGKFLQIADTAANLSNPTSSDPDLYAVNVRYRLNVDCQVHCTATLFSPTGTTVISEQTFTRRDGTFGLRVHNATARFEYLVAYDLFP